METTLSPFSTADVKIYTGSLKKQKDFFFFFIYFADFLSSRIYDSAALKTYTEKTRKEQVLANRDR